MKLKNSTKVKWQTPQKCHSDNLLNFCALYEAQKANSARTFEIWFYKHKLL